MRIGDIASIFPGLQQFAGGCTIVTNFFKTGYDLGRAAVTCTWKGSEEIYNKRDGAFWNQKALEAIDNKILSLPGYKAEKHALYMLIGIVRMIPVVATIFSIARLCGFDFKQVVDDPRAHVQSGLSLAPSFNFLGSEGKV